MVPLGFMPQHVWEVGASVMAAALVVQGVIYLIKGNDAPEAAGWNPRIVRIWAAVILLLGVGVGFAAFFVDAEQPGAHNRDRWGGSAGVATLSVWVALMVAFSVLRFRRSSLPRGSRSATPREIRLALARAADRAGRYALIR